MATSPEGEDKRQRQHLLGVTLFLAAMAFAGSTVVASKRFLVGAPVFLTTFATLLVALAGMLPLQWSRRRELLCLRRAELGNIALQGLFGIVLFRVFTLYGLRHTGAIQAGIITGTTPAVITLFSVLFLRERPRGRQLLAVFLAVCGVMAINLLAGGEGGGEQHLLGGFLILGAVVSESLLTIFRKAAAARVSSVTNTTVIVAVCCLLTAPLASLDLAGTLFVPDSGFVAGVLWYGLGATVLGYLCFMAGSARIAASTAGVLSAMLPLTAVALSALILGQDFTARHLAGCLLVVAAIILTATASRVGRDGDCVGCQQPCGSRQCFRHPKKDCEEEDREPVYH